MVFNFFSKRRQTIFILSCFIIVALFILIMAFSLLAGKPGEGPGTSPTPVSKKPSVSPAISGPNPSNFIQYSKEYEKSVEEIAKREKQILEKDLLVSKLQDKLPYQGRYFKATYAISNNRIYVYLNKDKQDEGNKEFDDYLKTNSILSRSWIRDLSIVIQ